MLCASGSVGLCIERGSMKKVLADRSYNMARVRGDRDTRLERRLASLLWKRGIRGYRRRCRKHLGRPDFCFHAEKVAVFIDGCFWHMCPVHFQLPATKVPFWKKKLADNRTRDQRQARRLRADGWTVIRIWNHELKTEAGAHRALRRVIRTVQRRQTDGWKKLSANRSKRHSPGERRGVPAQRSR